MKRAILLAALLAAGPAMAQDTPFLKDAALNAEVARNCADGCLVLSPAEAEALMAQVQAMVLQREQRAFQAGAKSCRNAV
jgi:hypothetical protein